MRFIMLLFFFFKYQEQFIIISFRNVKYHELFISWPKNLVLITYLENPRYS